MAARRERIVLGALLVATALLRLVYVFQYRIDSDEPQHLHVAWGWAHGLLQYRDVFDNHAPLFYILCAPLVAWVGERPAILFVMRLAMLPLYAVGLWSVYAIGAALYSRRVAWWGVVLAALFPSFFLTALEFRTDDLWTVLWLVALVVLVRGHASACRSALAGLLLGAALAASLKTVLLLLALAAATAGALVLSRGRRRQRPAVAVTRHALALGMGLAIIPAALTGFFAARGALAVFLYGTVLHNAVPGIGAWHADLLRPLLVAAILPALWFAALALVRGAPTAGLALRGALVFLAAGVFVTLLVGVWPIITPEDFLPVAPLAPLFVVALLLMDPPSARMQRWLPRVSPERALLLLAGTEAALVLIIGTPWEGQARQDVRLLADVLRLTRPHEYVMDLKGETVFRRRPFYYTIEAVTKARLRQGWLADTIPERLIATRTRVVVDARGFPPRAPSSSRTTSRSDASACSAVSSRPRVRRASGSTS
jgi:hypothetical protein